MIENGQQDGGYVLIHDGHSVPFRITRRDRKSLAITVHPDLGLEVVAPKRCSAAEVLERVEKRASWIVRQRRYFTQFHPTLPDSKYFPGETHLYLGRQYRLKVHTDAEECVKLIGRFLHVWVKDRHDRVRIGKAVSAWYSYHANRVLNQRTQLCLGRHPSLRPRSEPRVIVRAMKRRWGSCTKSGTVMLNRDLIKAPIHCVDYVITHELCHLRVHDHSRAFYDLLASYMPDWRQRKSRLEQMVVPYQPA